MLNLLIQKIEQTFRLPTWHDGQIRVNKERRKYSILCAHRGWWKTSFSIRIAFEWLLSGRDMGWWSPTYKHVQNAWIDFRRIVGHDDFFNKGDNTFTIQHDGRKLGTCYFFSMVDATSARGYTLPGIGDEMGLWDEGTWDRVVKPVVNKYGADGWFLGNGTPNTSNPYNDFQHLIEDSDRYPDQYASWIIPCYGADIIDGMLVRDVHKYREYHNPISPFDSWESCVMDYEMSHRKTSWAIEHLCHFVVDEGGQFTGINETCNIPECDLIETEPGRWFLKGYETQEVRDTKWTQMGVDVALAPNFTVIIVIDRNTNKMCYMHRFQPQGTQRWELVEQSIVDAYNMFPGARINLDGTGAGGRLVETLPRMGLTLNGWGQGTNKMCFGTNKERILDELSALVSRHQISLFRLNPLILELQRMVRVARQSGVFDIRAPKTGGERGNDDIVSALSLAYLGVRPTGTLSDAADMTHMIPTRSWWMDEQW